MRSFAAIAAAVLLVLATTPARAGTFHYVDDDCRGLTPNPYFTAGGLATGWYRHQGTTIGVGGCHMYTTTTTSGTPQNFASFYLPVQSQYNGNYRVWERIADDSHSGTVMRFVRYPNGSAAGGTTVSATITSYKGNFWRLASMYFTATAGGYVKYVDSNGRVELQAIDYLYYEPY